MADCRGKVLPTGFATDQRDGNAAPGDVDDAAVDAYTAYTRSKMYRAMRPLFLSLKLFGFHFSRRFGSVAECRERATCRNNGVPYTAATPAKRTCTPSLIYAAIVATCMSLFFLKSLSLFVNVELSFGPDLFYRLQTSMWILNVVFNSVTTLVASYQYEALPKFFLQADRILNDDACLNRIRKFTRIAVFVMWLLLLQALAVQWYLIIAEPDLVYPMLAPFERPFDGSELVMVVIVCIIFPFGLSLWMFPYVTDLIFSYALSQMLSCWTKEFRRELRATMTTETLVKHRLKHGQLCELIDTADRFLNIHKGGSLLCNVAIILFIVYSLLYAPPELRNLQFLLISASWIVLNASALALTCFSGIIVNQAAHEAYDDLHSIEGDVDTLQVYLFTNRLSSSSIGLTAFRMFVFDKPALIAMLTMLLTNFIVIIQFSPSTSVSTDSSPCNCSATATGSGLI